MSDEQTTDLELQTVFNKITTVLQEHPNVGGFVALHNREGGEFKPFFPIWTTATFRPKGDNGMALHFKVDLDPNSVDNQDTVSMLIGLRETTLRASAIFENVAKSLAKHIGLDLGSIAVDAAEDSKPFRPEDGH